ncbi:Insulin-like growth factor 2 mRNA-binding protein 2 [Wickerhamomyces ciferrii]|uniref:Insulin-like growth factor 2 mRNA-binding protein 2 n=1 Tax=Wickerhamomyces ciferrii (strain ATCC 14091 / BCRC 22168 / CBS 111 / JCM 3599 / NBRC 0793 / NRRL Y-1031 F-60-10) TaxID=1206466 RepID=K0KJG2_WICCF|nr:Insulin-like growth factor 2 mRNA-binding protein 2 [Wickerhamomyces ciferrii]CCH41238.1 Insulin-like growth factor 2 mRNA-binding protein 2 [Wickerhamomyces ciferrii]
MTDQETSESLFDTKFTSDSTIDTSILPSTEITSAIIGFRILVSVKEAGIVIGKNGSVIADIRDQTGVKAGVSRVVQGCPDRILTVTGPLDSTAQALGMIAKALATSPLDETIFQYFPLKRLLPPGEEGSTSLRLLIPNAQMGTIIGRQGARIKTLQENYDVRLVASKDFLQNSTERLVELQGLPEKIEIASKIIARCLIEDWHSAAGTSFYLPTPRIPRRSNHNNNHTTYNNHQNNGSNHSSNSEISKTVNFPSQFVGCLIGKAGSRIQEIRKVSGAQITIASEDDDNNERSFTLVGSNKSVDKALSFLQQNLEKEKERREKLASADEE